MDIKEEKRGEVKIVSLHGRLDASATKGLEQRLLSIIDEGGRRLVLDLADLSYISSMGLRVLILLAKNLQKTKGSLALAALSNPVSDIFEIAGFTSIFSIYRTCDEAVAFSKTESACKATASFPPTVPGT